MDNEQIRSNNNADNNTNNNTGTSTAESDYASVSFGLFSFFLMIKIIFTVVTGLLGLFGRRTGGAGAGEIILNIILTVVIVFALGFSEHVEEDKNCTFPAVPVKALLWVSAGKYIFDVIKLSGGHELLSICSYYILPLLMAVTACSMLFNFFSVTLIRQSDIIFDKKDDKDTTTAVSKITASVLCSVAALVITAAAMKFGFSPEGLRVSDITWNTGYYVVFEKMIIQCLVCLAAVFAVLILTAKTGGLFYSLVCSFIKKAFAGKK